MPCNSGEIIADLSDVLSKVSLNDHLWFFKKNCSRSLTESLIIRTVRLRASFCALRLAYSELTILNTVVEVTFPLFNMFSFQCRLVGIPRSFLLLQKLMWDLVNRRIQT